MANSDLTIVFDPDIGGAEAQFVRERLDLYNVGVTGVSAWYPVKFFVKSARGETLGRRAGRDLGRLAADRLPVDRRFGARQGLGHAPDGPG